MGKGKDLTTAEKQNIKLLRDRTSILEILKDRYWNHQTIKKAIGNITNSKQKKRL